MSAHSEHDAYQALQAAGFGLHTTWGIITGSNGGYRYAWRGDYRTRRRRTWVAVWAEVVKDGQV